MKFSQIIITYNNESHVRKCIDSVLEQSVLPQEIIIGDDYSTDNTRDILKEYQKRYPNLIRLLFHEQNKGIAANLNSCAEIAIGDYVGFLAGDDWLLPNKNKVQFDAIEKYGERYGLYFSDFLKLDSNKGVERIYTNVKKEGEYVNWVARRLFSIRTYWLSKKLFMEIGGFDESLYIYEDWHFKLKLSLKTKFKLIPGVFSVYQLHDGGIHNINRNKHIECMNKIVELFSDSDLNRNNIEVIHASVKRQSGNISEAFIMDPLFYVYRLIYMVNYYFKNIWYLVFY